MDRRRVALVIPALNESRSIGPVVSRAAAYGTVIVVNDGSTDDTAAVATAAGATVVNLESNRGYDRALDAGFARAGQGDFDVIVTLDADGQHDPSTLVSMLAAVEQGADVVVGVRDRQQRLGESVFAWWGRRRWQIDDPLCGMKAYRMAVYRDHGCFDSVQSIGTELAICARVRGFRIAQVPVPTRPRLDQPRFGTTWRANFRIFRALLRVSGLAARLPRAA